MSSEELDILFPGAILPIGEYETVEINLTEVYESEAILEDLNIKERFVIDDYNKCFWYIEKIKLINYQRDELKRNYEAMLKDLDRQENSLKYLFENQFIEEILKHIPPDKKSVKTLVGKVQFRKCEPTIIVDEKEAIPRQFFFEKVTTTVVVDKESILKEFAEGRDVDGVRYLPERDNLSIS